MLHLVETMITSNIHVYQSCILLRYGMLQLKTDTLDITLLRLCTYFNYEHQTYKCAGQKCRFYTTLFCFTKTILTYVLVIILVGIPSLLFFHLGTLHFQLAIFHLFTPWFADVSLLFIRYKYSYLV